MSTEKINVRKIDLTIENLTIKKAKSNYKQDQDTNNNKDQNDVIYISEVVIFII
jgi:hypothetical protein